jgi:hypothetical protein
MVEQRVLEGLIECKENGRRLANVYSQRVLPTREVEADTHKTHAAPLGDDYL